MQKNQAANLETCKQIYIKETWQENEYTKNLVGTNLDKKFPLFH